MSFKDILLDLRSMRRSTALRKEDDPNKVANILEEIIKESIHLQNGGDKGFQRKSMAELKQIRRDLVAGQINAGDKSGKLTVVYSSVIDALSKAEDKGSKGFEAYEKTAETLRKSIPTSDSLISALMTANPLMGYGVKMVRDMTRSAAESRQRSKLEAAKKIALLREQEAYLTEQFKAAEDAEKASKETTTTEESEKSDKKTADEEFESGLYKDVLDNIQKEIQMLVDIWSDEPVSRIEDAINELASQQAQEAEAARIDNEELAEKARRDQSLDDMRNNPMPEQTPVPIDVDTAAVRDPDHAEGGLLSSIMGSIGKMFLTGIGGLFAAGGVLAAGGILATLLKPITGIIKFFAGIGKVAVKLAGKLLLPVTVIMAIYDFFDAFFNASEYLGKADNKITMKERISLGIANIIASIVKVFDDVLEFFGVDMIDTDGLTKKIHEFFMGFPDMVMRMINDTTAYLTDMYGKVVTSLKGQVEDVESGLVDAYTDVVDKVMSIFSSISDTFKRVVETIEKKFGEWKQTISNIPGIGALFSTDPTEPIKLDPLAVEQAGQDLKDMTSSTNLLRINEGVATMVPLEAEQSAEQQAAPQASKPKLTMVPLAATAQPSEKATSSNATMVPAATGSQAAGANVQRAEQQLKAKSAPPVMVNAPQSTVNNINQGGGTKTTNTSNQNHKFRRLADR